MIYQIVVEDSSFTLSPTAIEIIYKYERFLLVAVPIALK
jgi:hypothetical protein